MVFAVKREESKSFPILNGGKSTGVLRVPGKIAGDGSPNAGAMIANDNFYRTD